MARISEKDLVLPALYVIKNHDKATTSVLIKELTEAFKPTGEDAEILAGRTDTKFSQKVRNLVSHDTLDKRLGYTIYSDGFHKVSESGEAFLREHIDAVKYLFENDFEYEDVAQGAMKIENASAKKQKLIVYDENIVITEGRKRTKSATIYVRSKKLREKAIEKFSSRGVIICQVCDFDFQKVYGELGKGYIEIHHLKPIFKYEKDDFSKFLNEALKSLSPLCSNCHRMVHRNRKTIIRPSELREIVRKNQL